MTEEEKEIVIYLEWLSSQTAPNTIERNVLNKAIATILNLIQKQQEEIKKLRDKNKDLLNKLRNRVKEVKKLSKYSLYKEEFSRLNAIIKKKDKQIDLMAEEISNSFLNTCPLEDYNTDLDCEKRCNNNYKECWKQYFEKQVEEV